jgi:single-strand DNA-binding protein
LGIAVNGREKVNGNWEDRPDFFNVTVWGAQAENAVKYLSKGSPVAIDGRLRYESWESDGQKRSTVKIVAQTVQYLGTRNGDGSQGESAGAGDSDIPF